jgi:hypothetical protein
LSIQQFLAKNKMVVVSHHPYSPDLAPCGFFVPTDEAGFEMEALC